jgi:hypothetical protein
MTIIGQTEKIESNKRVGILRRVDRISTLPQPEFQLWRSIENRDVYVGTLSNNKLASRESVTGSFGEVLELEQLWVTDLILLGC